MPNPPADNSTEDASLPGSAPINGRCPPSEILMTLGAGTHRCIGGKGGVAGQLALAGRRCLGG